MFPQLWEEDPAMFVNNTMLFGLVAGLAVAMATVGCVTLRDEGVRDNASSEAGPRKLVILHTNDIHGYVESWAGWEGELSAKTVGGFDRIASVARSVRAEAGEGRVLLLDAGDAVGDTMIASRTEGRAIVDLMNAVGYDAMAVGNHEPDFAAGGLAALQGCARFPLLAANLIGTGGAEPTPCIIREVAGVKVGILGLAYPNTPLTTAQKNVEGLRYRTDSAQVVQEWLPKMRRDGAELIVVLSHLGLGADRKLAERVRGIDVIVGGHSHNRLREATRVGETLIVQAGAHGSDVGRLDLVITGGRVVQHRRELIALDHQIVPADDQVTALVGTILAPHRKALDERIGSAETPIVRAQTLAGQEPRTRDKQSPADSLFADVLRETTGSDIALLPGVGYGVAIPRGTITAGALRNLIPHDSKVVTMTLTGERVRQVLEQSVENTYTDDPQRKVGGIIQVSGMRFRYDPAGPAGGRVLEVRVSDRPLDPGQRYRVATNAMLAQGGHNYRAFLEGTDHREEVSQYEMIKEWIRKKRTVTVPTDERIGRIAPRGNATDPNRDAAAHFRKEQEVAEAYGSRTHHRGD